MGGGRLPSPSTFTAEDVASRRLGSRRWSVGGQNPGPSQLATIATIRSILGVGGRNPSEDSRNVANKPKGRSSRALPPLEKRFTFLGDASAPGDRKALRSAQFEVVDQASGFERNLKLWRKTGGPVDTDLRQLWLHEMRQVQRVMSYAGAREVIVDILEFVEDAENFGVLLEHTGQPLTTKLLHVSRQHWLKNLGAPRPRSLFWRNIRRLVTALGIIHAQGLVHGNLTADSIMTEGGEDPDFQLTGFEWSLWLTADKAEKALAKLGASGEAVRAERYSFAEDWRALGKFAAYALDAVIRPSGEVQSAGRSEIPIVLNTSERVLLKRLFSPTRMESLDSVSIARSIDDIVADVGRSISSRSGTFVLSVLAKCRTRRSCLQRDKWRDTD